ncbi:PepSY-associated TM helix domain-containing protein [Variovorax ginsengisoli]
MATTSATPTPAQPSARFYRAVWRWHFYAGLLVLPFLVWLSVTGGLFVFKNEIDGFFHRALKTVPAANGAAQTPGEIVAAALAANPGEWFKYTPAAQAGASAEVGVVTRSGARVSVYVDPHDGRVLGSIADGGSVAWTIRRLHSLKYFGTIARGAIEMAAGWAVLLIATGIYLWWPRGRRLQPGGVLTVRGKPRQRVFWRDLHAVTGILVGAALVFLALTGMPWSVLWGAQVNRWANGTNFGYPSGVRVDVPMSTQRLNEEEPTAWSLAQARLPQSMPQASPAPDIGIDAAAAIVERLGIGSGYTLAPPRGPTDVYTASVYPDDLARQRVIHLDRYSGRPLVDMRYADYGPLGRWLEWGINVHLGQEFGVPNKIVLVLACLGIVLLCMSAAVMWWKRRPAGSLGVPPAPADRRTLYGVAALLAVGGVAFPLVGASLLVMLVVDLAVVGRGLTP